MRAGTIPVRLIANCIAHVPRGSAIGEYYGGALAITAETEALWEISYLIAKTNAKKPSSVKPRKMPIGVKEYSEQVP